MTDYGTKLPTSVIFDDLGLTLLLRKGSQKFRTTITSCSEADHLYPPNHQCWLIQSNSLHLSSGKRFSLVRLVVGSYPQNETLLGRSVVSWSSRSNTHFLNCLAIDILANMAIRRAPRNEKYARFSGNFLRPLT